MSDHALLLSPNLNPLPEPVDPRLAELKQMVLDSVVSPHSKRNYGNAIDGLFVFAASRPLTRALLLEWRAGMEKDSSSIFAARAAEFARYRFRSG